MARKPFLDGDNRLSVAVSREVAEWVDDYAHDLYISRSELLRAIIDVAREGAKQMPDLYSVVIINHLAEVCPYGCKKATANISRGRVCTAGDSKGLADRAASQERV